MLSLGTGFKLRAIVLKNVCLSNFTALKVNQMDEQSVSQLSALTNTSEGNQYCTFIIAFVCFFSQGQKRAMVQNNTYGDAIRQ